jgi:hypothetical protein
MDELAIRRQFGFGAEGDAALRQARAAQATAARLAAMPPYRPPPPPPKPLPWLPPQDLPALERGEMILQRMLKDGPQFARDIEERFKLAGLSESTMRRARKKLNIKTTQWHRNWLLSLNNELLAANAYSRK